MAKLSQYRTPEALAEQLKAKASGKKRALGIDLGTNCGVAWADFEPGSTLSQVQIFAGQLDLNVLPYETGPLRFIRLKQFLNVLQPDLIGYEDVKYTPPTSNGPRLPVGVVLARVSTAAELLGGLKTILVTWATENDIPVQSLGIGRIKRYATGNGRADKKSMILAANDNYGVTLDADNYQATGADNIADAMHIAAMMIEGYDHIAG